MTLTHLIFRQRAGAATGITQTAHGGIQVQHYLRTAYALQLMQILGLPEVLVGIMLGAEHEGDTHCRETESLAAVIGKLEPFHIAALTHGLGLDILFLHTAYSGGIAADEGAVLAVGIVLHGAASQVLNILEALVEEGLQTHTAEVSVLIVIVHGNGHQNLAIVQELIFGQYRYCGTLVLAAPGNPGGEYPGAVVLLDKLDDDVFLAGIEVAQAVIIDAAVSVEEEVLIPGNHLLACVSEINHGSGLLTDSETPVLTGYVDAVSGFSGLYILGRGAGNDFIGGYAFP